MQRSFRSVVTIQIALTISVAATTEACASDKGSEVFNLLAGADKYRLSHDAVICEKAFFSKLGDLWINAYIQGRTSEADQLWHKLLVQVKDCESIGVLIDKLYYRLRFLPDEKTDDSEKMAMVPFYLNLLKSTEKAVGKEHRFCAELCGYLSSHGETTKDFKLAIKWRQKQLDVLKKVSRSSSWNVANTLFHLGYDYYMQHDYRSSEPLLLKSINIADKNRYQVILKQSVTQYCKLLRSTDRKSQALVLQAKYRSRFRN